MTSLVMVHWLAFGVCIMLVSKREEVERAGSMKRLRRSETRLMMMTSSWCQQQQAVWRNRAALLLTHYECLSCARDVSLPRHVKRNKIIAHTDAVLLQSARNDDHDVTKRQLETRHSWRWRGEKRQNLTLKMIDLFAPFERKACLHTRKQEVDMEVNIQ